MNSRLTNGASFFIKNAEIADYSQNTQTDWECGDDANYVSYATIPVRFIYFFKIASGHRVIARVSGVDDTWTLASAYSASSLRFLRSLSFFMISCHQI